MGTRQTSPGKPNYRGLDLEKTSRLRSRQKFFLDIPFNRTHLTSFTIAAPGPAVQGKARCERHLRSCNEARKRSLDRKRLRVVAWAE